MDVKTVFPNLNVMWVRWSDYTLMTSEFSGPRVSYLAPAPGAAELRFNCAEQSEQLVADALELGRQLRFRGPSRAFGAGGGKGPALHQRPRCAPLLPPVEQPGVWRGY